MSAPPPARDTASIKFSTLQGYRNILNKRWMIPLGNYLTSEIHPSHIKTELSAKPITAKTKRNILGPLSGVFEYAIDEGHHLKSNPCSKVKIAGTKTKKSNGSSPQSKKKSSLSSMVKFWSISFSCSKRECDLANYSGYAGKTTMRTVARFT